MDLNMMALKRKNKIIIYISFFICINLLGCSLQKKGYVSCSLNKVQVFSIENKLDSTYVLYLPFIQRFCKNSNAIILKKQYSEATVVYDDMHQIGKDTLLINVYPVKLESTAHYPDSIKITKEVILIDSVQVPAKTEYSFLIYFSHNRGGKISRKYNTIIFNNNNKGDNIIYKRKGKIWSAIIGELAK